MDRAVSAGVTSKAYASWFSQNVLSAAGISNPWYIFYYFLFPAHMEDIGQAEFRALALRLGIENEDILIKVLLEEDSLSEDDDLGDIWGLWVRNYAGDFQCVCAIIPGMGEAFAGGQILPDSDHELPMPTFVGFGKRERGVFTGTSVSTDQMMRMRSDYERRGRHPVVYVAAGTHNTYWSGGPRPLHESVFPEITEVDGIPDDVELPPDPRKHRKNLAKVSVWKFLTMGFIAGLFSSIREALRDEGPAGPYIDPVPGVVPSGNPQDVAPNSLEEADVVIAPSDTIPAGDGVHLWREGVEGPDAEAAVDEDVVAETQIWWPPGTGGSSGYLGAWGPDCADNPFGTRDGIEFPDFKGATIEGILQALSR